LTLIGGGQVCEDRLGDVRQRVDLIAGPADRYQTCLADALAGAVLSP
jgi:hypothetical protein